MSDLLIPIIIIQVIMLIILCVVLALVYKITKQMQQAQAEVATTSAAFNTLVGKVEPFIDGAEKAICTVIPKASFCTPVTGH